MTTVPNPTPSVPENLPGERQLTAAPQTGGFLANLSVPQKLLLSSLVLGIPLALAAGTLGNNFFRQAQQAEQTAEVTAAFGPLQSLQRNVRYVNGLSAEASPADVVSGIATDAQAAHDAVHSLEVTGADELAESMLEKATTLSERISARNITPEEIITQTESLLNGEILQLFRVLGQEGNLFSNTTDEGQALANMSSLVLPTTLPAIGSTYGELMVIADQVQKQQKGVPTAAQKETIARDLDAARRQLQEIQTNSERMFQESPALAADLSDEYQDAIGKTASALDFLEKNLVNVQKITVTQDELGKASDPYFDAQYAAFSGTVKQLENSFGEQSARARNNLIALLVGLALLAALLYFLLRAIINAITQPLNSLTNASQRLAQGDFGARVPLTTRDELGTLAGSFNAAAVQLEENERRVEAERIEQQRLQNNIGQFLDVTMDIADGDLTKRGVVTEDVLGNVVDSINVMTEELSYVLGGVQQASASVTNGSQAMLATTSQIQEGTAMTAAEARRVAQQVEELTASVRQMAEQAQASADAARQALLASQQGQEAVTGTLDGMQNIRREVQGVAKSIKGLGDRSLEIQEIVDTISGIARQTNLLALNATIEAAGAGEAGGRFSIVADEVRKLADNSAAATSRIASLIQNIQAEIQDVVVNVEESTREVEQGYRVAGTAGERLREIGSLTQQSAQLAENISAATQQQVQGIEQMGDSVQQIAQIAQRSEQSVEEGRAAADQLQRLADQLNASLARFRLPS